MKQASSNLNNFCVAAASVNQIPLAFEHNRDNILKAIACAWQQEVKLLCFPELCITGYGAEDAFLAENTSLMALKVLEEIVPATKGMAIAVGLPYWHERSLYNTACIIYDAEILGFVAKQNLARDGVHYEPRWFTPWPANKVVEIKIQEKNYLLGDQIFTIEDDVKIGFEICEDAWVSDRTAISLASREVDIILNPSASHFAFAKANLRKAFVLEGAREFGIAYIYANLLGNEAGRIIYDGDTIIAAGEELLACGPRFSFQDYIVTTATLDIESLRAYRAEKGNHSNRRNLGTEKLNNLFALNTEAWEKSPHIKEEEFTRAVALGLFDYLCKTKVQGFVLSLSGGADSSACACLIFYMVQLGIQNLGAKAFQARLSFMPAIAKLSAEDENFAAQVMQVLLFCLYQQSKNNSSESQNSAQALSEALCFSYAKIEIDSLVESYCDLISNALKKTIDWETENIALQNIQARVRSPSIWLLANLRQALLICTNNRSEAALGYATMDGDTAGGLCPIAGIDKYFLLQWLQWLEKNGPMGLSALPVLAHVLALEPSAELRPLHHNQKDEDELMPFAWLAAIERLFINEKLSAVKILKALQQKFPKAEVKKLAEALELFYKLWSAHQWKRERIAPGFHVDEISVDPKTWCRFPILSGHYKNEIEEMWEEVRNES